MLHCLKQRAIRHAPGTSEVSLLLLFPPLLPPPSWPLPLPPPAPPLSLAHDGLHALGSPGERSQACLASIRGNDHSSIDLKIAAVLTCTGGWLGQGRRDGSHRGQQSEGPPHPPGNHPQWEPEGGREIEGRNGSWRLQSADESLGGTSLCPGQPTASSFRLFFLLLCSPALSRCRMPWRLKCCFPPSSSSIISSSSSPCTGGGGRSHGLNWNLHRSITGTFSCCCFSRSALLSFSFFDFLECCRSKQCHQIQFLHVRRQAQLTGVVVETSCWKNGSSNPRFPSATPPFSCSSFSMLSSYVGNLLAITTGAPPMSHKTIALSLPLLFSFLCCCLSCRYLPQGVSPWPSCSAEERGQRRQGSLLRRYSLPR